MNFEESRELVHHWNTLARVRYRFYVEYTHRGLYHHAKHTELICDTLEKVESGEITRLMLFMPPRHSKSMTVTESFPSFFIGKQQERRVIAVSYGDRLARKYGRSNRQKVQEFGDQIFGMTIAADKSSAHDWTIANHRGGMLSTGIGGAITGEGADLLLIDDPIKNRKEADSITYRDFVWAEYQNTLVTRLQPNGAIILICTRWHHDDLAGRILASEKEKWTVIQLPALAEENDILGREPGQPLWPERGFNEAWAQDTRETVGSKTWIALYQQRPTAVEGEIFKREYWRYYRELPVLKFRIQSYDTAFKKGQENDYTVRLSMGTDGTNYYVFNRWKQKVQYPELVTQFKQAYGAEMPDQVIVEDKASGQSVIPDLKKNTMIPVKGIPVSLDKVARANQVSPLCEAGKVFLPENAVDNPWVHDFVETLCEFPAGEHDDDVDAFTQGLKFMRDKFKTKLFRTSDEAPGAQAEEPTQTPEEEKEQRYKVVEPDKLPLDYFDRGRADDRDVLLKVAIRMDKVPPTCLLGGEVVMECIRNNTDPCEGCYCNRDTCRGRHEAPFVYMADEKRLARRAT